MSRQKQPVKRFSNIGFSTILITFVMICIVTFCALALLTANSDYKLSKKVADRTTGYFQAEELAYQIIADIDKQLSAIYSAHSGEENYKQNAAEILQKYADEHTDIRFTTDDSLCVSYTIPVTDTQTLSVSLQVCYPPTSDGVFYQLTEWKSITEYPQEDDTSLHLLGT
jgi:hypothetical protein